MSSYSPRAVCVGSIVLIFKLENDMSKCTWDQRNECSCMECFRLRRALPQVQHESATQKVRRQLKQRNVGTGGIFGGPYNTGRRTT